MLPNSFPKPIRPPRRGKQRETQDQKKYIQALNLTGLGFFYRVKTTGTFDPSRGVFRRDLSAQTGIPDICGFTKKGLAVYIECKYVEKVENKKKLIFQVKHTQEQWEFLLRAHRSGCRAGVAFTLDDALAIAHDDPVRFPRHPRTYLFLPEAEKEAYAEEYTKLKKAAAQRNRDPLAHVLLSTPTEEECT